MNKSKKKKLTECEQWLQEQGPAMAAFEASSAKTQEEIEQWMNALRPEAIEEFMATSAKALKEWEAEKGYRL